MDCCQFHSWVEIEIDDIAYNTQDPDVAHPTHRKNPNPLWFVGWESLLSTVCRSHWILCEEDVRVFLILRT